MGRRGSRISSQGGGGRRVRGENGHDQAPPLVPGTLYLVATPIGNLADISERALDTLRAAEVIAAEDTRHTRKLTSAFGISAEFISYRDVGAPREKAVLEQLRRGRVVALVSDAGTPGISDPAFKLVRMALDEGIDVRPVPGPAALICALAVSGLAADRFVFEGFLPPRRSARISRLEDLRREERTLIFYESPHRLMDALTDIADVLGDRSICLARELTKVHEEFVRGKVSHVMERISKASILGECVIVCAGMSPSAKEPTCPQAGSPLEESVRSRLRHLIGEEQVSRRDAAKRVAEEFGVDRRWAYKVAAIIQRP